jgi:branched-chain amino acid transport system ATP-binding protein
MAEPLLTIEGLTSGYGDIQVLWGVDIVVQRGEIACIVGSNGAGKTTLLKTVSGLVRATGGRITFDGKDITGAAPHDVTAGGIAHVPEGRRLFRALSVRDNLLLGAYLRDDGQAEINKDLDYVYSIFPILKERSSQDANTLSGGEQQMCAVGRGLMSRPKLLIIDELSLGLAPRAVELLGEALLSVNGNGTAILLVEQDIMNAFDISDNGFVIDSGAVTLHGPTSELADNPMIQKVYMGL